MENLDKILAGDKGFEIHCQVGNLPTDTELVFEKLFLVESKDKVSKEELIDGLIRLSLRQDRCWLIPYYLVDIFSWERNKEMKILTDASISEMGDNLLKRKTKLEVDFSWDGKQYPNGLWGDVSRLLRIIKSKYGKTVIESQLL